MLARIWLGIYDVAAAVVVVDSKCTFGLTWSTLCRNWAPEQYLWLLRSLHPCRIIRPFLARFFWFCHNCARSVT